MTLIEALDFSSVFVFALTGALTASRAQLDIIGFAFLANLTALGGGTTRDVLLDRNPIFWINTPSYIVIATLASLLVFLTAYKLESRLKTLYWLDAAALAIAVAAGTGVAISLDQSPVIIALMGIITGCMGGLMRDVVCNELPLVLKQGELYVSAALIGTITAIIVNQYSPDSMIALLSCAAMTFILRAGSLAFGWKMPIYKHQPPKK